MKKFIVSLVAIFALGLAASAANYTIDETAIDSMFEMAVEAAPAEAAATASTLQLSATPDPLIATVLGVVPVTGALGIHRLYMGTSILTFVLYVITGGGFGVVYFVDAVCLVLSYLDNSTAKYFNDPSILMWL